MRDPLRPFLADGGIAILDGGLATELEARGCDLDHALWSARVLREAPDVIRAVHASYLEAGADVACTSRRNEQVDAASAEIEELGRQTIRCVSDVADRGSLENLLSECVGVFGEEEVSMGGV